MKVRSLLKKVKAMRIKIINMKKKSKKRDRKKNNNNLLIGKEYKVKIKMKTKPKWMNRWKKNNHKYGCQRRL